MQEEEAAAGEEFPLEIKESQPSRWAQTERGGWRESGLGKSLGLRCPLSILPSAFATNWNLQKTMCKDPTRVGRQKAVFLRQLPSPFSCAKITLGFRTP